MAHDWPRWHEHYDNSPPLQARLRVVSEQIHAALLECPPGTIRIASVCSGDGRDLLAVLPNHPRRTDARAWLLDMDEDSLQRGSTLAAAAGVAAQMEFVRTDASMSSSYAGIVPVDLLIVSGVLGHLRHPDVAQLIQRLPTLCRRGASVIWNRHIEMHDGKVQVPRIRQQLRQAGFEETHFEIASRKGFAVGRVRFTGRHQPLDPSRRLFEFVGINTLAEESLERRKSSSIWSRALGFLRL